MCCCLYNLAVRILLLNLYYPPDTSATAKMAQTVVDALAAAHEVTIVCGRPSYEPTERRAGRFWGNEKGGWSWPSGVGESIRRCCRGFVRTLAGVGWVWY